MAALSIGGLCGSSYPATAAAEDINYTYDALGRLTVVEHPSVASPGDSDVITYSYDTAGNRTSVAVDLYDRDGDGIPDGDDPSPNFDQRKFGGILDLLFQD